jgi:hypothetical protein
MTAGQRNGTGIALSDWNEPAVIGFISRDCI